MGNSSAKSGERGSLLSKEEVPIVTGCFKSITKNSEKIREDDLMKYWGSQMDPRLAQYISNFLFGPLANRGPHADLKRFGELFVHCVRGSIDDRALVLFMSLGQQSTDADIAYPLIKEYVEAVAGSYMRALRLQGDPRYKSWEVKNFKIDKDCVQKLGENLVFEVVTQGTQKVTRRDVEKWLQVNPVFIKMLSHVFLHLYAYRPPTDKHAEDIIELRKLISNQYETNLLPNCEGLINTPQFPAFIDISQIIFINSNLPIECKNKWRFLFSSQMHGESFSTFLGRILNQGSTVIVIEDSNGFVFGGFAPAEWSLCPNFVGNGDSFLFTLKPKMRSFESTSFNDHYQYLNLHQQTMPNGLGMGGQFDYWGLWIDSDYGVGMSSESCTTYRNYIQLSSGKEFKIKNLEVWGVGEIPEREETDETRASVLDGNVETKAMLAMIGKKQHSEGLRDAPPDHPCAN